MDDQQKMSNIWVNRSMLGHCAKNNFFFSFRFSLSLSRSLSRLAWHLKTFNSISILRRRNLNWCVLNILFVSLIAIISGKANQHPTSDVNNNRSNHLGTQITRARAHTMCGNPSFCWADSQCTFSNAFDYSLFAKVTTNSNNNKQFAPCGAVNSVPPCVVFIRLSCWYNKAKQTHTHKTNMCGNPANMSWRIN